MSEEAREFFNDSRDKKITARSASSTRTHCGKSGSVKFPSDYLSKKELKAMSGECKSYRMNSPMTWEEFKELPDDLKVSYVKALREKYNVPNNALAEMFGVCAPVVTNYFKCLGLAVGSGVGGKRSWDKEGFLAWRGGARDDIVQASETPVEENDISLTESTKPEEPVNDSSILSDKETHGCCAAKVSAVPKSGQLTFNCPVDQAVNAIATLLGGKNVELFVEWRVIADEGKD
jgi:hypothetical protein